jgi:hypothetical protein
VLGGAKDGAGNRAPGTRRPYEAPARGSRARHGSCVRCSERLPAAGLHFSRLARLACCGRSARHARCCSHAVRAFTLPACRCTAPQAHARMTRPAFAAAGAAARPTLAPKAAAPGTPTANSSCRLRAGKGPWLHAGTKRHQMGSSCSLRLSGRAHVEPAPCRSLAAGRPCQRRTAQRMTSCVSHVLAAVQCVRNVAATCLPHGCASLRLHGTTTRQR